MTVATIPQPISAESVYVSDDPAYDWQAQAGPLVTRWKADATGISGDFLGGPYALGLRLVGFAATNQRVSGNVLSFSVPALRAFVSYQVTGGQVKERIKLLAPPPVATIPIPITAKNLHLEQAGDGGLWAVSDLDGSFVARVPAPTCDDAKGVSGPIRYALSPNGRILSLVLDAAWLATAAYPVRIDPTVVTSTGSPSLQPAVGQHTFRMGDGKRVVVWLSASSVMRSTSTDGVTWTAPATVFTGANGLAVAACANGDTIYGVLLGTTGGVQAWKMAYATGAFTDTGLTTIASSAISFTGYAQARWDSVKSCYHVLASGQIAGPASQTFLFAINTSLALITSTNFNSSGDSNTYAVSLAVDGAATPNVYACYSGNAGLGRVSPFTFSGTAYTAGAVETALTTTRFDACAVALDQSNNLDVFIVDNGALKTVKRTGVNTYSATTTLVSASVPAGDSLNISRTGNANADIFVIYRTTANQTGGEIYYLKRTGGSWGAATLLAGGDNTGWTYAGGIDLIQSDGNAHVVYLHPASSVVYDASLTSGQAPSAPINVLPSGNANTSLTPPTSGTYKNTNLADGLGKSRILVTRTSDGVVFWDTGAVAAPGAPTLAIAAGTALGIGAYKYQVTFVTQVDAVTTGETQGGTEATVTTTSGNQAVNLTAIPTGPAGTIQRKIYRTAVGGATGTEKLVATIADNTTTTYADTVADASLGAAIPTVNTASIGVAYSGAAITDGQTFSTTYAGTALVKGTGYQIQMQFWDALANLKGPLSTAVTFQINDAPTVTITGPTPYAAEPSSGLAVTWTYAQTLAHAQASFQVKVLNAGQTATVYDSGVQTGVATSWTVPTGTLANNTSYVLSVTATSSDGL